MSHVQQSTHVEIRSGARGERAFIAGHRVRVQDVVLWNEEGLTPDEIVVRVPSISLADIHAALTYYYDHRDDIDGQIRDDHAYASEMETHELPHDESRP